MRRMSKQQCLEWILTHRFCQEDHHFFPSDHCVYGLDFVQPNTRRAFSVLAHNFALLFENCSDILLYIFELSVWPFDEFPEIVERAMLGYGDSRPLIEAPGLLFDAQELQALKDWIHVGLLSGWSGTVLAPAASMGVVLTDDDWIGVFGPSQAAVASWIKDLVDKDVPIKVLWEGDVDWSSPGL